jgi:trans-aconitate methyltransferase
MDTPADHAATFDAASAGFARIAPVLWNPLGERLVRAGAPVAGERVLDVCCGTGASALPAARLVGPAGAVDAVDVADGMLAVGRAAAGSDLPWLRFIPADVTTWTGDAPYDLVQSGYGVFFLPDMDADSRRLASLLRPGGRFAVLAWSSGALRTFATCVLRAYEQVSGERPEPSRNLDAAARIDSRDGVTAWLGAIGLTPVAAEHIDHTLELDEALSWDLVMGTGYRALVSDLSVDDLERMRCALLDNLAAAGVDHFDAGSVLGVGVRPGVR